MGKLIAAMATSHAFALMDPDTWDGFRQRNREIYKRLYGKEPPILPALEHETAEANQARYAKVRGAHEALANEIARLKPDVLLVVGDDQNEHYRDTVPQIAIYNGPDFRTDPEAAPFVSRSDVADILLERLVRDGFDVMIAHRFADDRLIAHAHAQILDRLVQGRDIPVVPIFVNGIHVPALEPSRCHALGQAIMRVIDTGLPAGMRVAAVASGGLSHFTAGYPWRAYNGPFHYGAIDESFDRGLIAAMQRGNGAGLAAELSSQDLLDHGDIEFRCWLVLLGMVGGAPVEMMAYEPFYRAIMGVGVARWSIG